MVVVVAVQVDLHDESRCWGCTGVVVVGSPGGLVVVECSRHGTCGGHEVAASIGQGFGPIGQVDQVAQ